MCSSRKRRQILFLKYLQRKLFIQWLLWLLIISSCLEGVLGLVQGMKIFYSHQIIILLLVQPFFKDLKTQLARNSTSLRNYYCQTVRPLKITNRGRTMPITKIHLRIEVQYYNLGYFFSIAFLAVEPNISLLVLQPLRILVLFILYQCFIGMSLTSGITYN